MNEVDWGRYNLPAIWSLISDVDVCTGSDRVLAWDGLAVTMREQHKRLLAAADSLAEVWPPERNDSARFFLQQVNGLADSMRETLEKAENTKVGLQGVVNAFSTAQDKIRDLAAGRQGVSDDWMPRFVDHAEDKYDQHAQAAMREAEAAIQDHGSQIQPPALFQMGANIDESGHHLTGAEDRSDGHSAGGSGRSTLQAAPVPVPVHAEPPGAFAHATASSNSDELRLPGSGTSGSPSGPVLSSMTPTSSGGAGIPSPGVGASPDTIPGNPVTVPPGSAGPVPPAVFSLGPTGPGGGTVGEPPGEADPGSRRSVSVRRAMPSGAVIGDGYATAAPGGSGATAMLPMGGAAGGGKGGRSPSAQRGQASQHWRTRKGVAPVIEPDATEVRHDPGPGVIGIDG